VGYLNFPFGLLEQYSFLGGWNLYRYYSAKNCRKMKLMTIVLQKKNFNISAGFFGFLYSDRVNYVMGLCLLIHIGSVLCLDGTFYQVSS
jgi:hypothetical protein